MTDQEVQITLQVEGIVCTGCATDMETVLLDTNGILDVTVSYTDGTVIIVYNPSEINQNELLAKIESFGMKIRIAPHP